MPYRFERFAYAVSDLSRFWHKIASKETERYDLKGSHFIYMAALYRHPEGLIASQLCTICGKDRTDFSRAVRKLVELDLITRTRVQHNIVHSVLYLSDEGKAIIENLIKRAEAYTDFVSEDLSEEEVEAMYASMNKIITKLRVLAEEGLPEEE